MNQQYICIPTAFQILKIVSEKQTKNLFQSATFQKESDWLSDFKNACQKKQTKNQFQSAAFQKESDWLSLENSIKHSKAFLMPIQLLQRLRRPENVWCFFLWKKVLMVYPINIVISFERDFKGIMA